LGDSKFARYLVNVSFSHLSFRSEVAPKSPGATGVGPSQNLPAPIRSKGPAIRMKSLTFLGEKERVDFFLWVGALRLQDRGNAPGGGRNHSLWLRRPTLYPVELRAQMRTGISHRFWRFSQVFCALAC